MSRYTDVQQAFQQVPFTGIESYVPYGVKDLDAEAVAVRTLARQAFITGSEEWPRFEYPKLISKDYQPVPALITSEKEYQKLLAELEASEAAREGEETDAETELYEKIARKLAEVYRHKEFVRHEGALRPGAAELSWERSGKMSAELFGEINPTYFQALLAEDMQRALDQLDGQDMQRSTLAREYLERLGYTAESAQEYVAQAPQLPSLERSKEADDILRGDFDILFPGIADGMRAFETATDTAPAEAIPAFAAALRYTGLWQKGWRARLIPGSSAKASTSEVEEKEITIGEKREAFTPKKLIETPVHEAMHALRKQNASEQPDPHLRLKTAKAREIEEGFVDAIAQIISGQPALIGKHYYVQLGLQLGWGRGSGRQPQRVTYRELYEIMWRREALASSDELSESQVAACKTRAESNVYRTMRGGPDFRDASYFASTAPANEWLGRVATLPQKTRLQALRWALSGVFNPTNEDDVRAFGGDPSVSGTSQAAQNKP